MMEARCIPPFSGIGFVGAGQIDGIETFIVPDGCRQQADLEFMCWLICHEILVSLDMFAGGGRARDRFARTPRSHPAPKSRAALPTPHGQNSDARIACTGTAAGLGPFAQIAAAITY